MLFAQVNGTGQLADGTMVFEMGLNVICIVNVHTIFARAAEYEGLSYRGRSTCKA